MEKSRREGAWGRRQKTEAAWPCLWCTMRSRGWEENVPRQLVGNDRGRYRAVFCFFKVRPGFTAKSASGWPRQTLLTSAEGGAEEETVVVPRIRKGMVPWCSPAPLCLLREMLWLWQLKHFLLSSVKKKPPKTPKRQSGALRYINSRIHLAILDFTGATRAIWDI